MSYHGDKAEAMCSLASLAATTEVARRLQQAIVTDGLVTRVLAPAVDDPAEMREIVKGMTRNAILAVANRELAVLDDEQREELIDAAGEAFHAKLLAAVRHAWTVAEMLDYPPEDLHPEAIAFIAAVYVIPADSTTADADTGGGG